MSSGGQSDSHADRVYLNIYLNPLSKFNRQSQLTGLSFILNLSYKNTVLCFIPGWRGGNVLFTVFGSKVNISDVTCLVFVPSSLLLVDSRRSDVALGWFIIMNRRGFIPHP